MPKKDKELLEKILDKYKVPAEFPQNAQERDVYSREYLIFKKESADERVMGAYEKMCSLFGGVIKANPGEEMRIKLEAAIRFTGMNVTPQGVASLAIVSTVVFLSISFFLIFLPLPLIFKLIFIASAIIGGYLIYRYPLDVANVTRVDSGSDVVMAVLYMTIYMKSNPSLEGALRFAANNVSGKLSKDLKSILWAVESGKYSTVEEGLTKYLLSWKEYNKEFVESVLLIREAMIESSKIRRESLLDKSIDIILIGTDEKMKKYARDLETPIMVLQGLGVLLPTMGMVIFPLLTIFLSEEVKGMGIYLALGYDVILPAVVYFFMKRTLEQRPPTHTKIDISKHPDYIAGNNVRVKFLGKTEFVPALPLAFAVALIFLVPGINFFFSTNFFETSDHGFVSMLISMSIVVAMAVGLIVYNYASSFQKIELRRSISRIEGEFEDALFSLGTRLSGGTPIESAIKDAEEDTKELEISSMFRILLKNINRLSMTFKQALFDPEYGALRYYPSALITTVMKAVSESVEKGTRSASMSMLAISRYLRDIRSTQEKIVNILSSIVSSMKFQAFVLIPVMSAVVVAIAQLIIQILINLGKQFKTLQSQMPEGMEGSLNPSGIFPTSSAVSPETLQVIVGIYVLEILAILGIFITRIEFGNDETEEQDTTWRMILFGIFIYVLTLIVIMAMFSPLIKAASMSIG